MVRWNWEKRSQKISLFPVFQLVGMKRASPVLGSGMIDTVNARGNGLDLGDLSAYPTLFGAANPKLGSRLTLGTLPTRLHISRTTGNQ